MTGDKISRKTFRLRLDEMICSIRDDIISGRHGTGDYLPSEYDLGKKFQLSNKSVRKGLDVLVNEGLIEKIPKVGNLVAWPSSDQSIIVRLGYHRSTSNEIALPLLLSEFRKKYPHILVQPVEIPKENIYQSINEYINAGMLDVVSFNQFTFRELVENDRVELLQPCQPNEGLYPFVSKAFDHGSQQFVQPIAFSPVLLCYNRDHFAEAGISEPDSSWTWKDLLQHAERLAIEKERFGFYFHLFSTNRWPLFLLQNGSVFSRNAEGHYMISDTGLIESLDVCGAILDAPNVFPTMLSASDADAEELFLAGKVSMILTSYFALNDLKNASFPYDVAPVPHLHDFKTLLIVIGFGISRKSQVKEAARQLVDFLQSPASQLTIRQKTLSLPALKSAAEWSGKELIQRPSRFNMYREIIPTYRLFTDLQLSTGQLTGMFREVKQYWSKLHDKHTLYQRLENMLNNTDDQGKN